MKKARMMLILDDPFYGALSMRMKLRPINTKNHLETAIIKNSCAIDGKQIVYDPNFIDSMSIMECKGLLAHEISHIALKHNLRRGKRDWRIWNMAGDFIIDPILKSAGFELPDIGNGEKGHYDSEIAGTNVERGYEILKARFEEQAKEKTEQLRKAMEQSQTTQDDENENEDENDNDEIEEENLPKSKITPQFPPDPPGEDKNEEDEFNLDNLDIPNMPGQGVVLDMPIDMNDNTAVDEADENLTIAIEQAYKAAKMHGNMPIGMERLIEKQKEHIINWKEELFDFMEKSLDKTDYSWMTPSRRYLGHGFILPGLTDEEELPQIVVVCDTSGSVSNKELEQYGAEISSVLEEFECKFKVIYCDTRVQGEEDFSYEDLPIKLNAKGGGGTCFEPAFDYIKEKGIEAEAIVFFTDMDAWDWNKLKNYDPQLPVLWLDSYGGIVDRIGFELPFGKHILLDLDS
jgi:predicted metal-dependent peptidase